MDKKILPFNWQDEIENAKVCSIGNDFILLDKPVIKSIFQYPFKVDAVTAIICLQGTMKGITDMRAYTSHAPCLFIILPEQILQYESLSEDFSGLFIVMSKQFLNDTMTNIRENLPLNLSVRQNPWVPLTGQELNALINYFYMMKDTISVKENPYRIKIAKHLTKAFFYGAGYHLHKLSDKEDKSKQEMLLTKFLTLVQAHYKEQRKLNFYADKLCLTPKHLSKVIKETGGKPANEWINDYVVLEAKALLKSTNMTIQQISDELNFPSQSFFGKYFKRVVGVSPKEYRGK
jgi:AraC-like DNA-binding protein